MLAEELALADFPEPSDAHRKPAGSAWWFTIAAYVFAILIVAFAPELGDSRSKKLAWSAVLAVTSFLLVWVVQWVIFRCHRLLARWSKGCHYDGLYEFAAARGRKLDASQQLIRRLLRGSHSFTGISASVYQKEIVLEFPKKGRKALPAVGALLELVDYEGGSVVGTFEITQSDGKQCQATGRGDIDPLFHGYAIKANAKFLPANMALFMIPEMEATDE